MRPVYLVPVAIFILLIALLAWGLTRDPRVLPSVLIDQPVPQTTLKGLNPDDPGFVSAELKGRVVLVNFFASWCGPCQVEHPILMHLAREKGIPIYGIAYKDKPQDTRDWLKRLGDPFIRIGVDGDGRAGIDWGITGVPETFLIDAKGRIRYRHVGPILPRDLEAEISPRLRSLR
jgi:cytochrome c biogenesis protein CcmG/thiol:disulfide interchange protein DsbE